MSIPTAIIAAQTELVEAEVLAGAAMLLSMRAEREHHIFASSQSPM
jgi:hypothetical protein